MPLYMSFIVGLVVTMILMPPLIRYAEILRLVDIPDNRKVHSGRIPRIGGIAIVFGSMLPVVVWAEQSQFLVSFLVAVAVLFVFGVLDDRGDLDYRWKFLGQFIAATIVVVYGDCVIRVIPFFGLDPVSGYISIPLTIIVLVGITNAINLVDGLDGLAAGTTILSLSVVALLAFAGNGFDVALSSLAICGSLLGFLRFNAYPARVFMGDSGSQFLGFSSVVLVIVLTQEINTALNPGLPLLILGLPVLDTMLVMGRRIKKGQSPFHPDKNHIHHRLLVLGFDHNEAVAIIYVIQGFFVTCAVLLRYFSDLVVVSLYVGACLLIACSMMYAQRRGGKAETRHTQSALSVFLDNFSNNQVIFRIISPVIQLGIMLFLLAGSIATESVPRDMGVAAIMLLAAMLLRLMLGVRLRFVPLRLFIFVSFAFVVYLVDTYTPQYIIFSDTAQTVFFAVIAISFFIAIRNTRQERFALTTTDLLILFMVLAILFLPLFKIGGDAGTILVKLIVLFYASELVIGEMKGRWNLFVASSLVSLGILSYRGLGFL